MPEHIQYEDQDLFNPETHHEHSDVPVRPLFWFIVIFVVFSIVSHVALFLLYKAFVKGESSRMDPPQTQVARPDDSSVPQNQPLLQPFPRGEVAPYRQTPVTDLEDMRRAEERALKSYGWVDKQHGVVRIPIEDAKKMLAARVAVAGVAGAPATGAPASSPAGAAPPPGASVAPAGTPVPADTGVAPSATTTTGGHE
ncbi:MAG TPA: hypothetical protein VF432_24965 [Thermoanaerobaculia bacterium]